MKKTLFVFTLLCGIATGAMAQETAIGVTIGTGNSWLSQQAGRQLFHPAWNVGGTFLYSTARHWGFGFDIKYSSEGRTTRYAPDDHVERLNLDYVRVPIRATYFFNGLDKNVRLKVSLAPTMGFLAAARYIIRDADGHEVSNNSANADVNGFDFGLTAGAGINFRIAEKAWLTTELSYYNGFTNVAKVGGTTMNRNLALNVGVMFGIGK
jgi:hypothetical protein